MKPWEAGAVVLVEPQAVGDAIRECASEINRLGDELAAAKARIEAEQAINGGGMTDKYVEAAVAAALRKAADVCELHAREIDNTNNIASWLEKAILALPHDDSALRELMVSAMKAMWFKHGDPNTGIVDNEYLDIVDRVLGEGK